MKVLTIPNRPIETRVTVAEVPGLFPDGTQAVRFTVYENPFGAYCKEDRIKPSRVMLEAQEFFRNVCDDRIDKFGFIASATRKVYRSLAELVEGEKLVSQRDEVFKAFAR